QMVHIVFFFFSSRRRHTRSKRDWSSDVCSSDLGLWEGHRSGRPRGLSPEEREKLCDILDSGPAAYGLVTGIWTSPLVRQVIEEEFGQPYHSGHVRKLLQQLGYSMQRPTTRLVQADLKQYRKWVRYTYPNLKKTPKAKAR